MSSVASAAVAFSLCLITAPLVLWLLRRAQLVDVPSPRSLHVASTPRGGGLAPALGCLGATVAPFTKLGQTNRAAILVLACGMGIVGLADDVEGLNPFVRLLGQLVVAMIGLTWLGRNITGPTIWHLVFSIGVLVWVVGYVNAFNFMDGINGLSVVQVVIAGLVWWLLGQGQDVPSFAVAALIAAGAAAAFAPFNTPRARMFLGDVGSYFLGAWLAATAVIGLRAGIAPEAVLAPLAVYGADTIATLLRRMRRHEKWHEPHREHTYQRLVQDGWSHPRTSLVVGLAIVATSACGALSLTDYLALRALGDLLIVVVLGAYLALPKMLAGLRTRG